MKTIKFGRLLRILICLTFVLGVVTTCSARLPMNQFGTYWVQTHRFQIMNYSDYTAMTENPDTELGNLMDLKTTGYIGSFSWNREYTDPVGFNFHAALYCDDSSVSGGQITQDILDQIGYVSAATGYSDAWQVGQEPQDTADANALYIVGNYLKSNWPNSLTWINFGMDTAGNPTYSWLNTCTNTVQPDMISVDVYPYYKYPSSHYPEYANWFSLAMNGRAVANNYGIPHFAWLQSFEFTSAFPHWRHPSESEMRAEAFACLAMGYKGYSWLGYDQCDVSGDPAYWFVNPTTRAKNASYAYAQSIDSEVEKLGPYLRFLKSEDVRFVPNTGHGTPSGLSNWSSGAGGDQYIQAICVQQPSVDKRDALIGFFTDASGQRYFMIQNLWRGSTYSAADTSAAITIGYYGATLPVPGKVYRLDRSTGQSVEVSLNGGGNLNLSLPGGTAELFSYTPFSLDKTMNIAKDPGFESGGAGSIWNTAWGGNCSYQNNNAHSGSYSLRVGTAYGGAIDQHVPVLPDTQYQLSVWLKPTIADGAGYFGVEVFDSSDALISNCIPYQYITGTAGSYSQYTMTFSTPSNATKIAPYVIKNAGSGGYLYADDFCLKILGQNLVQNPGFESGSTSWDTSWGNSSAVNSNGHYSSSYSMRVGNGVGGFKQLLPVEPNRQYMLSGWLNMSIADGSGQLGAEFFDSDGNLIANAIPYINTSGSANTYYPYSLCFTAPSNAANMLVYVYKNAGSGGYCYADDICLRVMDQNLIVNPGFESVNANWNTAWGGNSGAVNSNGHWCSTYSMRVGTAAGGACQDIHAVPNTSYSLSGWFKQTIADDASKFGVKALDSAGNLIAVFDQYVTLSGTSYAPYTLNFTTPANTAKIRVYVYKNTGSGGYMYADNLYLLRD